MGKYILYYDILEELEVDRSLYFGIPNDIFVEIFGEAIGEILLRKKRLNLMIFEPKNKEILPWIS